jgi:hypothetical protein
VKGILEEMESSEEELEECPTTQSEVENSILCAFFDISYHVQQGFDNEEQPN